MSEIRSIYEKPAPAIDYNLIAPPQIVMPKQCNHCWCEKSVWPDHAQCCKCSDRMHVDFIANQ